MNPEQAVVEAFGLGTALATIGSDVKPVVAGVAEIKGTLQGAVTDIQGLKTNDARQDEQIKTLFSWKQSVETAPQPEYATRADFEALRSEVVGSRLSWPKLLTGAAAIIGGLALLLNWAAALGAFSR